jgi:hypothetical protein
MTRTGSGKFQEEEKRVTIHPTPALPFAKGGRKNPTPALPFAKGGSKEPTPALPFAKGGSKAFSPFLEQERE